MKDFISGRDMNVAELLHMASVAEANQHRMRMSAHFTANYAEVAGTPIERARECLVSCGSGGCLLGEYALSRDNEYTRSLTRFHWIHSHAMAGVGTVHTMLHGMRDPADFFGLSIGEIQFLFYNHVGAHVATGVGHQQHRAPNAMNAISLTPAEAIRRLRKFLYYKMRKSELLSDYDAAKRHEGNSMFCRVTDAELATVA